MQIVRRHRAIVGIAAAVGLLAGAAYTVVQPPMLTSSALVVLPSSTHTNAPTQVVIADSDPVLAGALPHIHPAMSLEALSSKVQVKSLTPNVLAVGGEGSSAAQAKGIANGVANSYVAYVGAANNPGVQVQARVLELATYATGTSLITGVIITALIGGLAGALLGAIGALAISRNDRRLRKRDEIADAIGVPVLASIPVMHPSDAAGWSKLLEDYEPGVVHAWRLRRALYDLRLAEASYTDAGKTVTSLAVLSLASDHGALALGPQLAVFAASLGIPTALVIGPQQDANAVATLLAACAATPAASSRRSSNLQVAVLDHEDADWRSDAALTVVVSVVDGETPRVRDTMRATMTVLGVSSGGATAEQLARVAVSAAVDGRQIDGIFVADPDPADRTTGRVPQLARPAHRGRPTRLTGATTRRASAPTPTAATGESRPVTKTEQTTRPSFRSWHGQRGEDGQSG